MRKIGKVLWTGWVAFCICIIWPLGVFIWWVDPPFGGPIWGRVIAAWITFWFIFVYQDIFKRWRHRES